MTNFPDSNATLETRTRAYERGCELLLRMRSQVKITTEDLLEVARFLAPDWEDLERPDDDGMIEATILEPVSVFVVWVEQGDDQWDPSVAGTFAAAVDLVPEILGFDLERATRNRFGPGDVTDMMERMRCETHVESHDDTSVRVVLDVIGPAPDREGGIRENEMSIWGACFIRQHDIDVELKR